VYTVEQQKTLDNAKTSDKTVMIRSAEESYKPSSRPAAKNNLTWKFKLKCSDAS
jgi:hypothetical protein